MSFCPICCEDNVTLWGVWSCKHSVCYECALRVRKQNTNKDGSVNKDACMMCNQLSSLLHIVQGGQQPGMDMVLPRTPSASWQKVLVDSDSTERRVAALKQMNCRLCPSSAKAFASSFPSIAELNAHYISDHNSKICETCFASRPQVFPKEHPIMPLNEIWMHNSIYEDHPKDEQNFLGHPECKHCGLQVYDFKQLFHHVSEQHFSCSFCDLLCEDSHIVVYKDRDALGAHLRRKHFLCEECFEVPQQQQQATHPCQYTFKSEVDLMIHRSAQHSKSKKKIHFNPTTQSHAEDRRKAEYSNEAYLPDSAPPLAADGVQKTYGVFFVTSQGQGGKAKLQKSWLYTDKTFRAAAAAARHTPSGVDSHPPPQQSGRGRGRGVEPKEAVKQSIKVKEVVKVEYEVEFASESLHIGFKKPEKTFENFQKSEEISGVFVYVNHQQVGRVHKIEFHEKVDDDTITRTVKFTDLKKKLTLPTTKSRKRDDANLAALRNLFAANGVEHDIPAEASPTNTSTTRAALPTSHNTTTTAKLSEITPEIEDEIDTLMQIYQGDNPIAHPDPSVPSYYHRVEVSFNDRPAAVLLHFSYPKGYPDIPPVIEYTTDSSCGAASASGVLPGHLLNGLQQAVLEEYCGEPILYQCIDWTEQNLEEQLAVHVHSSNTVRREEVVVEEEESVPELAGVRIAEGQPITDRHSKFVGYCAKVSSEEEAMNVVRHLRSIKRIAVAAHPTIYAYRIQGDRVREGRDDDGESGAADNLLFLLQRAKVLDHIVVVTRYYGGKHLGPDRFRHINTVAKEILQSEGVIREAGKKK